MTFLLWLYRIIKNANYMQVVAFHLCDINLLECNASYWKIKFFEKSTTSKWGMVLWYGSHQWREKSNIISVKCQFAWVATPFKINIHMWMSCRRWKVCQPWYTPATCKINILSLSLYLNCYWRVYQRVHSWQMFNITFFPSMPHYWVIVPLATPNVLCVNYLPILQWS